MVQECGDGEVAAKWINGHHAMVQQDKAETEATQKTLRSWWRRKVAYLVRMIDDYVNHIFREHNQEADHLANLGVKGQRKITVDKGDNTENWKAVRGFWDGSKKTGGRCGCGIVIKGVDRDKWIIISNIAGARRTCTAMASEVVGASVLTGVLDLV